MSVKKLVPTTPTSSLGNVPDDSVSPSSNKRNIFSKLIKRKNSTSLEKRNHGPGTPSTVSISSKSTPVKPEGLQSRSLSNKSSIAKSISSIDHDLDNESGYQSEETFNENDDSENSSIYSNLHHTLSMSTIDPAPNEVFGDKLNQLLNQSDQDYSALQGFNHEFLEVPKYIKGSRRNKSSPPILKKVFLAQELNDDSDIDDEYDISSASLTSGSHNSDKDEILGKSHMDRTNSSTGLSRELFTMQFSRDGKFLAVAGRDAVIKIFKVISSPLGRMEYNNYEEAHAKQKKKSKHQDSVYEHAPVFHHKPVRVFKGHRAGVLALDWSKNNFLVSGSMDKTVKLWHVDRPDALATFQHEDFVTTVKFHPSDDRFFLSGSLDNHARLWSILERNIAFGRHLGDDMLITASTFTPDGDMCVFGGFNGTLALLETKGLHIIRTFDIKPRSLRPLSHRSGNKITSIIVFPNNEYSDVEIPKISKWSYLITSNDSKIRLISGKKSKLVTRFKGTTNTSSIEASMSDDRKYVLAGSEDHWVYIWENNNAVINNKLKSAVKDVLAEGKNHINDLQHKHKKYYDFIHKSKLLKKLNVDQFLEGEGVDFIANENSSYSSFHAHHSPINSAIFAPNSTKRLLELSDDSIFDMIKRGKSFGNIEELSKITIPSKSEFENGIAGFIIVTTDATGLIRVFRQDPAYELRKAILGYCKKQIKDNVKRSDSLGKKPPYLNLSPIPSQNNIKSKNKVRYGDSTQLSPSSSTFSVPLAIKTDASRNGTRPQLKSISNGIFDSQNGSFQVKSDLRRKMAQTPQLMGYFTSNGAITPEKEPSVVFPSIEARDSRQKVPLIVNTNDEQGSPEVVDFNTPVTSTPETSFSSATKR